MKLGLGIRRRRDQLLELSRLRRDLWVERHRRPFVFIHVNKTGGESVVRALGLRKQHRSAQEKREELGARYWDRKFTFGFVRNPWDRLVSLYSYRRGRNRIPRIDGEQLPFEAWVDRLYGPEAPELERFTGPQLWWLVDDRGKVMVDFVGRFERLSEDFSLVAEQFGKDIALPHVNASRRGPYPDYYSDSTRQIVERRFASDIDAFGYKFGT